MRERHALPGRPCLLGMRLLAARGHGKPDAVAKPHPGPDANAYADAHSDTDANAHSDANAHAHSDADSDPDTLLAQLRHRPFLRI